MKLRFALFAALLALVPLAPAQRSSGGGRGGSSSSATAPKQICSLTVPVAVTGTLSATKAFTCTIPANTMGLNSRIEAKVIAHATSGNVSNTTLVTRFGGAGTTSDSGTSDNGMGSNVTDIAYLTAAESNTTNLQQVGCYTVRAAAIGGAAFYYTTTTSITASQFVTVWITLGNIADTTTIQEVDVVLWP
jgi:hypothetical protein